MSFGIKKTLPVGKDERARGTTFIHAQKSILGLL